jgi:hypothetical protein
MTELKRTEITWEEGGVLQRMIFDAVVRQNHLSAATPTEQPVEEGADISDHVKPELDSLTMEVVVSNEPIFDVGTQMDGAKGGTQQIEIPNPIDIPGPVSIPSNTTVSVFAFDQEFDRVRTVHGLLLDLLKAGTRLAITTSLHPYEDMVLTQVGAVKQARTGTALMATVSAREIRVVSSETVDVPEPAETRGQSGVNKGQQSTTPDESGRSGSILFRIGRGAGAF